MLLEAGRQSCMRWNAMAENDLERYEQITQKNFSVSVVISAFQRYSSLSLMILALRRQKHVQLEIVLVDSGSWPPLLENIPGLNVDTYIYRKEDGLYHRVRAFNEGISASKHDIIILMDDDIVPLSDYWALSAALALHGPDKASIARLPLQYFNFAPDFADASSSTERIRALRWDTHARNFPYLDYSTCNMAIRRDAWNTVGGFDWKYDGRYGHDDTLFHVIAEQKSIRYTRAKPYGCAMHVGVAFKKRVLGRGNWNPAPATLPPWVRNSRRNRSKKVKP